jgi:hypothetical protein
VAQAVRGRADDASINYETVQVRRIRAAGHLRLNVLEDRQVCSAKAFFSSIRKADAVVVFWIARCVRDDTHTSA